MTKFKKYFYAAYILFLLYCAFIGFFYEDLVLHWGWDNITTWTGLIKHVLKIGGVGIVLLLLEIIVENIHLSAKNVKIKSLEKDITDLKAKLYDQDQPSPQPVSENIDVSSETESKDSKPE